MYNNEILYTVIFTVLIIFLLIVGVMLTIFISNRQRIKQQIAMTEMQLNFEKEIRTVEQEVQEGVLENLSRELHDNIGQLLTLMRLQLEQEKMDNPGADFVAVDGTLELTINQVRMMTRSLNSDFIEQSGLIQAIETEVSRLRQINSLKMHWNHNGIEPSLDKDRKLMAFRIFQEMLNNTLKHARAKNIYVALQGGEEMFSLSVKDDGKGYDVQQAMEKGGSGLKNMVKRASLAGFACEINSAAGQGSYYQISNN
ncbi:sensor histidine kinase [Chitinophagaceae bacterium MMS25-I14]